jgi:hypothetical protein
MRAVASHAYIVSIGTPDRAVGYVASVRAVDDEGVILTDLY